MSEQSSSSNMSFISSSSSFFLFTCIFFIGVGNMFNNKTLGMSLAIFSALVVIGYNIYSYKGLLSCKGGDCAVYGFLPFYTIPITSILLVVLVVCMILLKSVDN